MSFPKAAKRSLAYSQLRANLARATTTIRDKRARVVEELPDWEELRAAGAAIKDQALLSLDEQLSALEAAVVSAGGVVHWASDGSEACSIVARVARSHGLSEHAAQRLIIDGFLQELVARLAEGQIREITAGALEARLAELLG